MIAPAPEEMDTTITPPPEEVDTKDAPAPKEDRIGSGKINPSLPMMRECKICIHSILCFPILSPDQNFPYPKSQLGKKL